MDIAFVVGLRFGKITLFALEILMYPEESWVAQNFLSSSSLLKAGFF